MPGITDTRSASSQVEAWKPCSGFQSCSSWSQYAAPIDETRRTEQGLEQHGGLLRSESLLSIWRSPSCRKALFDSRSRGHRLQIVGSICCMSPNPKTPRMEWMSAKSGPALSKRDGLQTVTQPPRCAAATATGRNSRLAVSPQPRECAILHMHSYE